MLTQQSVSECFVHICSVDFLCSQKASLLRDYPKSAKSLEKSIIVACTSFVIMSEKKNTVVLVSYQDNEDLLV